MRVFTNKRFFYFIFIVSSCAFSMSPSFTFAGSSSITDTAMESGSAASYTSVGSLVGRQVALDRLYTLGNKGKTMFERIENQNAAEALRAGGIIGRYGCYGAIIGGAVGPWVSEYIFPPVKTSWRNLYNSQASYKDYAVCFSSALVGGAAAYKAYDYFFRPL